MTDVEPTRNAARHLEAGFCNNFDPLKQIRWILLHASRTRPHKTKLPLTLIKYWREEEPT